MNRYIVPCVMCLTLLGCQSEKPKTTMHRIQAGSPDPTGWIKGDSTFGHFSVKLPIPFNDFTVEDLDSSSKATKMEIVGCKSSEGIKFTATKCTYKMPGQADFFFNNFKSGTAVPGAIVSSLKFGNLDAVELSASNDRTHTKQRVVKKGDFLFLLIIEWPVGASELANKLHQTFFDSLTFSE